MSTAERHAPRKLFREEATTASTKCLACGGPITLRGFGAVEQVTCPYCGTELRPQDSGALEVMRQAERQRRQSILELHARGNFDGAQWEILGIVWRQCTVDGVAYPWQEFLLFNPYRGYRYLIYSMSDGHWSIGSVLDGAPRAKSGILSHKSVYFHGDRYKHFQSVTAVATYVEGEFPWQIHVGDAVQSHEYVRPPHSISIEVGQDGEGSDVVFTGLSYISPKDVWAAFGRKGSPPRTSGVSTTQPNPHKRHSKSYWLSFALLFVVWVVMTGWYVGTRQERVVSNQSALPMEPFAQEVTIGQPGKKTTLEFRFTASPLSNNWAFAEIMLVALDTEEAIGFSAEIDEWHGVSGGEAWREGSAVAEVVLGDVPGGTYLLQVNPQVPPAVAGKVTASSMDFTLTEDVGLARYLLFPFFIIVFFPLLNALRSALFEGRRWSNSDYTSE